MSRKIILLFIMISWTFFAFQTTEAGVKRVYVKTGPPTKKVVVVKKGSPPHPHAVWVEGHWHWNGAKYIWKKGYWLKPRKGFVWVPGHWVNTKHGWYRVEGHWKRVK